MPAGSSAAIQPLVDAEGLALYLGLASRRSVYELVESEGVPYIRVGKRRMRFDLEEVRAFLEARGEER
jgi:excisionase family DNA binding protein